MPGLDGYQGCFIALTGFGQDHDREKAIRARFDAHPTKPADPKELTRLLTELPREGRPRQVPTRPRICLSSRRLEAFNGACE
jgi:hypothetical protein